MLNRSLISGLRPVANLRASLALPAIQCRRFSISPARSFSAVFAETKNPQLNEILTEIQEKIILPAHLPEKARKLVFNPDKSDYIQRNPVTIEVDGLEHTFKTIDRFHDVPNSMKAFAEATKLMKTKEEWDNISTLLAGYKKAGIKLKRWHADAVTRRAGHHGQPYVVIECAQQVEKTGLSLQRDCTVILLLASINRKIISPKGEESETQQALKWNKMVWDIIQRPEHLAKNTPPRRQPHMNPVIRGMILFSQASAVKEQQAAGAPVDDLIRELRDNVEFITSAWAERESDDLTSSPYLNPINSRVKPNSDNYVPERQHVSPFNYILTLTENIRAIELAQEIIGEDAKDLQPIHDLMEKHIEDFVMMSPDKNSFGWDMAYERVTGRQPSWKQHLPAAPRPRNDVEDN
ncbi:hypothetical protein BFJ63_vAg1342 [Fusarium oxysporum f. sp. narcissi]|uniref:Uncharacterized protein n=1 Tax=Fusarium oxysporum f. sp. narcissi TaxID=451672 RepID=A0A4V1S2L2_FUSOX|nr:hypothetical protein BFJ70_g8262 [Fusarium oxysporum]RYC95999.1 hypothetical protein BFJ63_vAg1342 [Fusarium oxysporum f. sp. narcissi]